VDIFVPRRRAVKVIMLVGCSGTGKSTLAEELRAQDPDLSVISFDAILEEIAGETGCTYTEAYPLHRREAERRLSRQVREVLAHGGNVVWDQTNLLRSARARRLALIPDDYERIAVVLEAPFSVLVRRIRDREAAGGRHIPREVLRRQIREMERPDYDEGFDRIILRRIGHPAPHLRQGPAEGAPCPATAPDGP
jgi:predicted kinase